MFQAFWGTMARSFINRQHLLLQNIPNAEVTFDLYINQNQDDVVNDPTFSPSLPYTNIVQLGPEGNDLQNQSNNPNFQRIWHTLQNTFVGDVIQFGFHLSDSQMRNGTSNSAPFTFNAIVFEMEEGSYL